MADAAPTTANRTLPRRQPNTAYRQREYLTEKEVDRLLDAARKRGRNAARDSAAILLAYRHRSISGRAVCTSIGPRAGLRVCIRSTVLSLGR